VHRRSRDDAGFAFKILRMTPLAFLDFDCSEDEDGNVSFDALASVAPAQLTALQAELARVLDWANDEFADDRGPLDDGGSWDHAISAVSEVSTPVALERIGNEWRMSPGVPGAPRFTISFTLTGTPAFGAAFRQAFGLD
jgi:hypothetical protein